MPSEYNLFTLNLRKCLGNKQFLFLIRLNSHEKELLAIIRTYLFKKIIFQIDSIDFKILSLDN